MLSQQLIPQYGPAVSQPHEGVSQVAPQPKVEVPEHFTLGQEQRDYVHQVLSDRFNHDSFRPMQELATTEFIVGKDVLLISPTGSGKSLCYFIPTIVGTWNGRCFDTNGFTVVISPLIALINDQLSRCKKLNIPACTLSGGVSKKECDRLFEQLMSGSMKIVFCTPEKLKNGEVFDKLYTASMDNKLKRIVIDECHCVTMWGHEFREDYSDIGKIRVRLSIDCQIPLMATTATLTPTATKEVIDVIFGPDTNLRVICSTFRRTNLSYKVYPKKEKKVLEVVKEFGEGQGIVYCMSCHEAEVCAKLLREGGVTSVHYHAQMKPKATRAAAQQAWVDGQAQVICATIAFGMGIDKANVRFVVHSSMAMSLENYYQETGRAGRDGDPATCILLYDYCDVSRIRRLIEEKRRPLRQRMIELNLLQDMETYCISNTRCRVLQLLEYFNEKFEKGVCDTVKCDVCEDCSDVAAYDISSITKAAVAVIIHSYEKSNLQALLTTADLVNILRGTVTGMNKELRNLNPEGWPLWKSFNELKPQMIVRLLRFLISDGYLQEFLYRVNENVDSDSRLFLKLAQKSRSLNDPLHKVLYFAVPPVPPPFMKVQELVHVDTLNSVERADMADIKAKRSYASKITEQDLTNLVALCPLSVPDVRRVLYYKEPLMLATCMTIIQSLRCTTSFQQHRVDMFKQRTETIKSIPNTATWEGVPLLRHN